MRLDADDIARVTGKGRSTAFTILADIATARPDAVTTEGEGKRARQVADLDAVAEHLYLDAADVRILAGRR